MILLVNGGMRISKIKKKTKTLKSEQNMVWKSPNAPFSFPLFRITEKDVRLVVSTGNQNQTV